MIAGGMMTSSSCMAGNCELHNDISLQSVCAKFMSSWTTAVECHSAQKLHLSAVILLQIFVDLFLLVASLLPFL